MHRLHERATPRARAASRRQRRQSVAASAARRWPPRRYARGLAVLLASAWFAGHADTVRALGVGEALPASTTAIELVDLDDQRQPLGTLLGANGTMVLFASNTCPYMLDWLDRLPRIADFAAANDIAFLVVNANARKRTSDDSPQAMAALAETHSFAFPYWIDEDATLADALAARRTPEVFLLDADKRLVYHGALDDHSGPFDQVTEHWALDALRQMVTGKSIATPSTAPVGCAVQRPRRRPARSGTTP